MTKTNINKNLSNLNSKHQEITDLLENLFYFSDDAAISDLGATNVSSMSVQSDGKLILAGSFGADVRGAWTTSFFLEMGYGVIRINANGTLDETFQAPEFGVWFNFGSGANQGGGDGGGGQCLSTAIQSNGKIIVAGSFTLSPVSGGPEYTNIVRLNTNGTIDSTFNPSFNNAIFQVHVTSDDGIIVTSLANPFNTHTNNSVSTQVAAVCKILNDTDAAIPGDLDTTFNNSFLELYNEGSNYQFNGHNTEIVKVLNDGKILVPTYSSMSSATVLLLINSDASGASEVGNLVAADGGSPGIFCLHEESNGDVLIGGYFSLNINYTECNDLIRLKSNGNNGFDGFDGSFNSNFEIFDSIDYLPRGIYAIDTQSDGKILVGGFFNNLSVVSGGEDVSSRNMCRLNTDGTLDETFSTSTSFDFGVTQIKYLGVNDIWVSGLFSKPRRNIVKLNNLGIPGGFGLPIAVNTCGIKDGGNDLYDWANFINTDVHMYHPLSGTPTVVPYAELANGGIFEEPFNIPEVSFYAIPSTHTQCAYQSNYDLANTYYYDYKPTVFDGRVKSGTNYFGEGSKYFTNMYPGLFVLVAKNITIGEFSITGGAGNGNRSQSTDVFEIMSRGHRYSCYLKSTFNAPTSNPLDDPSLSHIIIVPGNPDGITHLYDQSSDFDDHCLQGLSGKKDLYYLIISLGDNVELTTEMATLVSSKFLDTMNENMEIKTCGNESCDNAKCLKHNKNVKIGSNSNSCDCSTWKYIDPGTKLKDSSASGSSKRGAWIPAITVCSQLLYSYPSKVVSMAPATTTTTTTEEPTTTTEEPTTTTEEPTTTTGAP